MLEWGTPTDLDEQACCDEGEGKLLRCYRLGQIALFSLTIFVSAALLLSVQPMFARMVLPLLGGTPQVWNVAMVFYQVVLLLGYLYAHVTAEHFGARWQPVLHGALLLIPLVALPIALPAGWAPPTRANPSLWLLAVLGVGVGLPYFVVSTSSPLLQLWFVTTDHPAARDPYFLYAASNLGSILGLLAYPFLLEPTLSLAQQSHLWTAGYAALAACVWACAAIVWRARRVAPNVNLDEGVPSVRDRGEISGTRRLRWLVWAFVPSSLMLSVTSYLSTDIASVPLLWIIPLVLYLLTFVLSFARKARFSQQGVPRAMRLALLMLIFLFFSGLDSIFMAPVHLIAFLVVALGCHRALADDRPPSQHLTGFYLWVALGGALGGTFNALLAPVLFDSIPEYRLVLAISALCFVRARDLPKDSRTLRLDLGLPLTAGALVMGAVSLPSVSGLRLISEGWGPFVVRLVLLIAALFLTLRQSRRPLRFGLGIAAMILISFPAGSITDVAEAWHVLYTERGFFGVHRVVQVAMGESAYHLYLNGTTVHGMQSLDPARSREPLSYYTRSGPIAQVFELLNGEERLHEVAVIGLGVGSLACYSQPGQSWTFYEIDPLVVKTAQDPRYFTLLRDCAPTAEIILGDGRLSLAHAADGRFDLIILDAYSSDSIPTHLLTRESLLLNLERLTPHGLLAYHVSNKYLDVKQVATDLALDAGLACLVRDDKDVSEAQAELGKVPSQWVIIAQSMADFGSLENDPRWLKVEGSPRNRVWTDDFASIVSVLRSPRQR